MPLHRDYIKGRIDKKIGVFVCGDTEETRFPAIVLAVYDDHKIAQVQAVTGDDTLGEKYMVPMDRLFGHEDPIYVLSGDSDYQGPLDYGALIEANYSSWDLCFDLARLNIGQVHTYVSMAGRATFTRIR